MVRAEVSNSVALKILVKNLPVKDTETYQQMMRMRTDDENFFMCVVTAFLRACLSTTP